MTDQFDNSGSYYFCLTHQVVEHGAGCRAADRMGPYPTAAAAEHWQSSVDARNQTWDEEDRQDEED